jgi:PAS domain S-box-containing protein
VSPLLGIPLIAAFVYGATLAIGRSASSVEQDPDHCIEELVSRNAELERELAERSRVEGDLRRTKKDLSTAQRLAHVGSWRWSYVNDELLEGSDEYCRIHGVLPKEIHELMKHQMERCIHPEDRERVEQTFFHHRDDERTYEVEYRIVRPNGEVRYVREAGEIAEHDPVGNEWVGTVQDITEEKRLEQALRAQSESLRLMSRFAQAANEADSLEKALQVGLDEVCSYAGFAVGHVYRLQERDSGELVSTGLWHLDYAKRYAAFRVASEQLRFRIGVGLPGRVMAENQWVWSTDLANGLSPARAELATEAGLKSCFAVPVTVGPDVVAVLEFFTERESELDNQTRTVVSQIGTQLGRVVEREQSVDALETAKGELEERVQQRTAELRDLNDALTEEIAVRKRAEETSRAHELQLERACQAASLGFATWNEIEQRYESISEQYAAFHGYTQDEFLAEFRNGGDYCLVHPDDVDRYRAWELLSQADKNESEIQFRAVRKDATVCQLREIDFPIYDDSGRFVQTLIIQQEITHIHDMEAQLRQAQKMEAVGQLTGGIAHDFNNLLAVILANLEMLAEGSGDADDIREWAEVAMEATDRGASLTQRLLAFSRKQSLRPEALNPRVLFESMLELLRRTLGEAVDIQVAGDSDLWLVEVDPSQLENALLNLAINARDAMPGGGQLTVNTSNVKIDDDFASDQIETAPGDYVVVSVSDTGMGMPPEVVDHVFEPFFTTKDAGEGSGLGLSMVYGFVVQSGGNIHVYSEEGLGTTIRIYLPRYHGVEKRIEERAVSAGIPLANDEAVLVVEDDDRLRSLVAKMLESLGYEVQVATSGQEALELLESPAPFDVLLTDVVLPGGMSGCDLGKKAAWLDSNIPVVYMSGYAEEAALSHGGIDRESQFLQKPFRLVALAHAIRAALDDVGKQVD